MNPLGEALLAAQRQAIGALSKAYVAGMIETTAEVSERLDEIGCRDAVEQLQFFAALDTLRIYGAPAPAATKPESNPETEPATDAQMRYLAKLADERGTTAPDYKPTKAQASTIIEQLKAGTYNPDEWTVPF